MTPHTKALIRDIKRAYKSRTNSSSIRHKALSKSSWRHDAFKSTSNARAHREEGNQWYNVKGFQNALVWYTMSVASALHDSEEQCKAYGNRSAVLFELQKYETCLLDINRALKGHCPNLEWRQKLLERKKRCLAQIQSSSAAVNDGVSRIDEDGTNPAPDQEPEWRADMLSKFGNPLLPNASSKIKLKYDTKWGRHFVATADINPGEPLISEEYFMVAMPGGEIRFKFCDFCTAECHALIPCPSCASILYCSEECRTVAYNQYHRMECKLLSVLPIKHDGSPLDPTTVRLFLVGTKQGAALENLMNNLSVSDIFEENYNFADKLFTSDYMVALRLKSLYDFGSISTKSRIADAVEVIKELRKLEFFESVPVNHLQDVEVFATALLLNNCRRKFTNRSITQDSAEGLLLLQNLMNHSCHPNVESIQRKRETIMFSLRPIKKNEQLFCCYNETFEYCPKPKRILGCMGFVCQCEACTENWPVLHSQTWSLSEAWSKIREGLQPKEEGSETLFAKFLNISAPLVDDTALKNLQVHEIVTIIAELVSLLYKMMKPMSYPLMEFRFFLVEFVEYFYNERERDLSWNVKLDFPNSKDALVLNDEIRSILPTDAYHKEATIRIYCVITRLNFYVVRGRFLNKNIVG